MYGLFVKRPACTLFLIKSVVNLVLGTGLGLKSKAIAAK